MDLDNFVHLHIYSDYSIGQSLIKIEDLVSQAEKLGMKSLALTDKANMRGVIEFYKECRRRNIKPIIGSEFYIAKNRFDKDKNDKNYSIILLAQNNAGYKNLMKLSTVSYLEGLDAVPRIDLDILSKYSEGLICLSGGTNGEIRTLILQDQIGDAENIANAYKSIFGANYFLQIENHNFNDEIKVVSCVKTISEKLNIPVVATNDVRYLEEKDAGAYKILRSINGEEVDTHNNEYYLKQGAEMIKMFPDIPSAIYNTQKIASMCNVEIQIGRPEIPKYKVKGNLSSSFEYLKELTMQGLTKRYETITENIVNRAEMELNIIKKLDFADYFLLYFDMVRFARDSGILVGPGRGNACSSVVCYALYITNVDPVRFNLIFERFINEKTTIIPDIDLDFCYDRRKEVVNYIFNTYSNDNVAHIPTFSNIRRKIKNNYEIELPIDLLYKLNYIIDKISVHSAGLVVGKEKLTEYSPLQIVADIDGSKKVTTQFSSKSAEDSGLIKIDVLGLKTLTDIKKCADLLKSQNIDFDLYKINYNDPKVFELFSSGNTDDIFQFVNPVMKNYLKRLQPTCLEELSALHALFRPVTMEQIDIFIARKRFEETYRYPHPSLAPALKETYGLIVYHEQLMEIARILTGLDYCDADILRKTLYKRNPNDIETHKSLFVESALKNGIDKTSAQNIFDLLSDYAQYLFIKSHAVAYATLAYQCAYLKTYYPEEFESSFAKSGD
ncbi:MAG: DNA polymerase III subunit alpha [Spirochaetes bacterium]|nr:DNA polymerase III subunit alpha [Spirochaetota bacterium]